MTVLRHEKLGLAAYINSVCAGQRRLFDMNNWIVPAIEHEQIMFVFDAWGAPIAYWTWAMLAPDVEQRLRTGPDMRLHQSEWNEGDSPWIIEFTSIGVYLRDILSYARFSFFAGQEYVSIRYCRRSRSPSYSVARWRCSKNDEYDAYVSRNRPYFHLPRSSFASSLTDWASCPERQPSAF